MSNERSSDSGSGIELLAPREDGIEAWRSLIVSPNGIFPGFVSEPCFRSELVGDVASGDSNRLEGNESGLISCCVAGNDEMAVKFGGSIAERRAAKFGFDASKINTSRFRSSGGLGSPACSSQYLVRTPGISPSVLLESPMMLSNLQPSPTTGAYALPYLACENGVIKSESSSAENDSDDTSSFTFNPHGKPVPLPCYYAMQNQYPPSSSAQNSGIEFDFQLPSAALTPVPGVFEFPTQLPSEAAVNTAEFSSPPDSKISSDVAVKANSNDFQSMDSIVPAGVEIQQNECNQGEDAGNLGIDQPMDGDQKVVDTSGGTVGNSEDGYNWRKYGQKQVKASEYPRSYYKCTHPNCQVKKKVEHCIDGQIIEIVYKGTHNHPKPQPNRRSTIGSSVSCGELLNVGEGGGSLKGDSGAGQRDLQHGYDDLRLGSDRRPDGLERTCSASLTTDASDPSPAYEGKSAGALESAGTPELSSTLASNEEVEEEEDATQGSALVVADDDNEPDLKRRKMESSLIETALASRAIREPRVIVQIESEVDILDDGYRWRKYGQKVVKGNPNPRSYYKCTHPGCGVRKHVERASHNLKFVLTTYEGKHNHEVPSARNSSHASSVGGNSASSGPDPQDALTFPRNSHLPKSEPQAFATHFDRKVEYNKEFLKHNYLGNFAGGAASFYPMKFPNLPHPMLYGVNPICESSSAPMAPNVPSLSIPPPYGFTLSSNMAFPNDSQGRPLGMFQPMFSGQPPKEGDAKPPRPMQD